MLNPPTGLPPSTPPPSSLLPRAPHTAQTATVAAPPSAVDVAAGTPADAAAAAVAAVPLAPQTCETLEALRAAQAKGSIAPAQRLAARNLLSALDALAEARAPDPEAPRNYWVGDIEGRDDSQLQTLIDAGVITASEDGKTADFGPNAGPGARLVFLGDIGDRGPAAIRARRIIAALAAKDPTRVDYTWGNRCISKLGLLNALPILEKLEDPAYVAWLSAKNGGATGDALKTANTLAARVQFWLEGHSAREQLDHHKAELDVLSAHRDALEAIGRKPVSLEEAAQDYVDSLKPGGEYFEFLRLGNWGVDPERIKGPIFAFHSGASATAIKRVPGSHVMPTGARQWNAGWLEMGKALFAKVEAELRAGRPVPSEILYLGDSDYDALAGSNSARGAGVTYGSRSRDKSGNYGAMSRPVAEFDAADGIAYEMVGHMPQPLPTLLKSDVRGVAKIYNDMSFVTDGSAAIVMSQGDLVVMVGRKGSAETGEMVTWSVRPSDTSPLGMVTRDTFTVHSLGLDGRYNLMRVANGRTLEWRKVTSEELAALEPRAASLDEKTEITSEAWFDSLGDKFNTHALDTLDGFFGARTPVWMSGSSAFAEIPMGPDALDALLATLAPSVGDRIAILTGGTNVEKSGMKAPEYRVHDVASANGIPFMGFVPEQTNTASFAPKDLFIAGKKSQWNVPIEAGQDVVSERGGASVFFGGGSAITEAIAKAESRLDVPVFLIVGDDFEARLADVTLPPRGASEASALDLVRAGRLPAHFHLVRPGDNLGEMLAAALDSRAADRALRPRS